MANINQLLARAAALRDETALNSISPERAGGIMYDTLVALNELWLQQGAALVISKIYASVAAMQADTAPVSDLTGQPLRPGQIVVIASSDSDNGTVYRYNGTSSPSWSAVGSIGGVEPVDSLDSDSTILPLAARQGKVLDGKINQLGQQVFNGLTVGAGNTVVSKLFYGLIPGEKYRFIFVDNEFPTDDVTIQAWILAISYGVNGSFTDLYHVAPGSTPEKYYDFTYGEWDCIRVSIRANGGAEVRYSIIRNDIVKTVEQNLSEQEKLQVQSNIGLEDYKFLQLWSDCGVKYLAFGNPGVGYVTFDANNKKRIAVTNNVCYVNVPIDKVKKYIELSGFTYTPSTSGGSTYTVILFFDEEDNLISRVTVATDGIMAIEKPDNATQCYIDLPVVHAEEIIIKSYDVKDESIAFDAIKTEDKRLGMMTDKGIPFNSFPIESGIISYNSTTNKKTETANASVCHIKVPIGLIEGIIELFGFTYKPSTAGTSVYTSILFFDGEDNFLSRIGQFSRSPYRKFAIAIPEGAEQCYVNVPVAYSNLLSLKTYPDVAVYDERAIVDANQDRLQMLTSSCRFRKTSETSKDFQMLIATDSHGDVRCVNNAIVAANCFGMIDAFIHCGDSQVNYFTLGENVDASWKDIIAKSFIPCFFVMGNHEKGTYPCIYGTPTDQELHDAYIKPIKDKNWIGGGYVQNKCYYYKDFASARFLIRLIVLDEYEAPMILDDTYWEAIPYNSALTEYGILNGESFSQGDEINVKNYTAYSFRAKQNISSAKYSDFTGPSYKYRRGYRWISQVQAQWFLDTLASTPNGYSVIVACHNPYSKKADVQQNRMFSQKNGWTDGAYMQTYMVNDFVADAVNAFQNKTNFVTTCESIHPADMLSYQVSKDFSSALGMFYGLVGGHVHQDCVWKHQTYNQYQITPVDTNSIAWGQNKDSDIRKESSQTNPNALDTNCLTVVSFAQNRIGLVKIGVNVIETGGKRDYEVIDTTEINP